MNNTGYLVQILLPLYDNDGNAFGQDVFGKTRAELTDRFGGLTAHMRAPARGLWKTDEGEVQRDDVVIFEVVAETVERRWWSAYRKTLESRFKQDEIMIRALATERL